jgi:hypothetical protein
VDRASDQVDPLSHTQKSQRLAIRFFVSRNASTVVPDGQHQFVILFLQDDIDPICLSVTKDVSQRFLKYTENGRRLLLI